MSPFNEHSSTQLDAAFVQNFTNYVAVYTGQQASVPDNFLELISAVVDTNELVIDTPSGPVYFDQYWRSICAMVASGVRLEVAKLVAQDGDVEYILHDVLNGRNFHAKGKLQNGKIVHIQPLSAESGCHYDAVFVREQILSENGAPSPQATQTDSSMA